MRTLRNVAAALALMIALSVPAALALADEGVVTANTLNLRTGPGTSYSRIASLHKGDKLEVTGETNGWYKVEVNKKSGYVSKDYVSVAKSNNGGGLLRRGSKGAQVKQLQGNLIYLGYLNDKADGVFGSKTEAAVRRYQQRNGLTADGIAGSRTQAKIQPEVLSLNAILNVSQSYLGLPYKYGGNTPAEGFDCSGFTKYVYSKAAGINIPRVSKDQAKAGKSVPRSQIRPGDLVAFNSPVDHVGIYIGNGKFIHSPKPGDVVKITSLQYMNLTGIRRFTGELAY